MVNPCGVETTCTSLNPVHFVPLLQQQLSQVAAVLPRNAGDQAVGRPLCTRLTYNDNALYW